jgi:hypothetical protein
MKKSNISVTAALALAAFTSGILLPPAAFAQGGATDPIPGTSKSGLSTGGGGSTTTTTTATGGGGGGGGKKSSTTVTTTTTTTAPAPTPVPVNTQPLVTGTLTMTSPVTMAGVVPQCTGAYRIDPYYPTLSLMTVDLSSSSVNVPDNSTFFVTVTTAGGTSYPFLGGSFLVIGGSGACTTQLYVTPGTTITGVTVTDILGTVVFTGK